ncbi:hypothetical protein ACLOJK_006214 [Asimina triloba]
MGLQIKEVLRNLCRSNGWLYAVVWQAKCRDSISVLATAGVCAANFVVIVLDCLLLLCSGDAYYEDQIGMLANKMLQQVHLVGEGLIGQVACGGGHRWIFSDTYFEVSNDRVPVETQAAFQTIAVISVSSQSVVQFGSSQKISEKLEFINHVKSLFQPLQSISGPLLSANAWKMLNYDTNGLNGNLASLELSDNYYSHLNFKPMHDNGRKEVLERVQGRSSVAQPYNSLVPGVGQDASGPHLVAASEMAGSVSLTKGSNGLLPTRTTFMNNSHHFRNQLQSAGGEAQVVFSSSNKPLTDVMQSNSSSANSLVLNYSTINVCSSSISTSTSMEQQLLTGMGNQGPSSVLLSSEHTTVPYGNTFQNFQQNPSPLPLSNANGSVGSMNKTILNPGVLEAVHGWISSPLFHAVEGRMPSVSPFVPQLSSIQTSSGKHRTTDIMSAISNPKPTDCINPPTVPLLEPVQDGTTQQLNGSLLHPVPGAPSSEMMGGDVLSGIPVGNLLGSVQNSTFCGINTIDAVHDGKKSSGRPAQPTANNDLFDCLGVNPRQRQEQGFWNDYLLPEHCGNHSDLSTNVSECITELNAGSINGPGKGSDHGLEQLLDAIVGSAGSIKKHNSDDQASATTITKAGSASMYNNHLPVSGISCLNESSSLLSNSKSDKIPPGCNKEAPSTSVISSWIDSSYNINAESAPVSQPKRPEEPPKLTRKRARPGESSRPRPKDRQQIQDRVKELREIVPNGAKCSIDNLLERTIKHMLFLQSVTKYAKKLKEVDEPKMIGEETGVVLKDSSGSSSGGATWAFEVGGQTMFCPIVVEDLNPPGQMLVEMLCEERGFFLEIADVIRGFGLTILKGVMEVRDSKIWARFVVEANRDVTRMDIFLSLVQLLQQTTSGTIPGDQLTTAAAGVVPALANYQQSAMPLPISMADRLQ